MVILGYQQLKITLRISCMVSKIKGLENHKRDKLAVTNVEVNYKDYAIITRG